MPFSSGEATPAGTAQLELAVERMRFALGVDLDLSDFHRRFRRDPLLGPLIRRLPSFRPRLRPWPWEALASAVVKQLIEADRAARIERRIVGRWGPRLGDGRHAPRDVPAAAAIAARAPAELASMDLAPSRAATLRRVAGTVAGGRCDPGSPTADRRLLALPQIGSWTVQCLALFGRAVAHGRVGHAHQCALETRDRRDQRDVTRFGGEQPRSPIGAFVRPREQHRRLRFPLRRQEQVRCGHAVSADGNPRS